MVRRRPAPARAARPRPRGSPATAADLNLSVALLDEQPEPGGQIYRGIERLATTRPRHLEWLGLDYAAGLELTKAFRTAAVDYLHGAQVWQIGADGRVFFKRNGTTGIVEARS